ncbi:MAG: hypothetical protein ETSY1_13650 [Candidatus Entotheonella factor]|nr:MAG: hypothetical protein ETSY1_13650 [Candidatus Entotheonella factor]
MSYFAYRAAPMGVVPAEVVMATFYNFAPRMVRRAVPAVWEVMSPAEALNLRSEAVDDALRRLLAGRLEDPELAEAAELARMAIEGCDPSGRALYAGHAALPWPDTPHLVLWHACTLMREHRGDCHAVALTAAEVDGVMANVLMAAQGHGNKPTILSIRGWKSEEWDEAVSRLVQRGWLHPDGTFTGEGRDGREAIERHTDRLDLTPYHRLGPEGTQRLIELTAPYMEMLDQGEINTEWPPKHLLRPDE